MIDSMLAMLAVGKKYIPAAELVHMRPIPERPFGAGLGRAREAMAGWVRDLGILDRDHQAKHTGTNRLRRLRT